MERKLCGRSPISEGHRKLNRREGVGRRIAEQRGGQCTSDVDKRARCKVLSVIPCESANYDIVKSHFLKVPSLPFHSVIGLLSKFPVEADLGGSVIGVKMGGELLSSASRSFSVLALLSLPTLALASGKYYLMKGCLRANLMRSKRRSTS